MSVSGKPKKSCIRAYGIIINDTIIVPCANSVSSDTIEILLVHHITRQIIITVLLRLI